MNVAEVDDMAWMRQLLDWQREAADPGEFLESLRYDLAVKEIFVFTPKGDVVTLPAGSTPVDFAYAVHTEVGHRCIGARVNGRLVARRRLPLRRLGQRLGLLRDGLAGREDLRLGSGLLGGSGLPGGRRRAPRAWRRARRGPPGPRPWPARPALRAPS